MMKTRKKISKKARKKTRKKAGKKTVGSIKTVGLLHSGSEANFEKPVAALKSALFPLNVDVNEKYAADLPQTINQIAADLVHDAIAAGPDNYVLVAAGGPGPALLLRDLTKNLPKPKQPSIVFTTVVTPNELGLVATLQTPTYNLTGMAGQTSELDPERLHMLFELAKAKIHKGDKIGVLVSKDRADKDKQFKKVKDKADGPNLKLKLIPKYVKNLQDIKNAFVDFTNEPVKGVVVMADSLFNDLRKEVVKCANAAGPNASGLPTIYQWNEFVELDGLISFGPDILEAYAMAGVWVKRIFGGEKPATIPCSIPSVYKVYVNGKTAQQQLGITAIPTTLLGYPVHVIP
jgi:ABC-type uncharacterized transport system substrate-binding protein